VEGFKNGTLASVQRKVRGLYCHMLECDSVWGLHW
jgi:hypothetical protein